MPLAATHAYLAVYGGQCEAIQVDLCDDSTAQFVADVVNHGGYIERVPLDTARTALFEPWPPKP